MIDKQKLKLLVTYQPTDSLLPRSNNPRTHSRRQVRQIANSIREFGFSTAILVDGTNTIVAGHGRVAAAKLLGIDEVPTIRLDHLTDDELRAFVIADNRIAERAGWDQEILAIEFQHLLTIDSQLDITVTGFEVPEIDLTIENAKPQKTDPDDGVEIDASGPAVSQLGDIWQLRNHRILCGNALDERSFRSLMGARRARVVFTDPPYNVPIDGHASGHGSIKHPEFAMACGEMNEAEFIAFLTRVFGFLSHFSVQASVHFITMDWRHMRELLASAGPYDLVNVCVWVKNNGGLGSLYRSQHELVFVFRNGRGRHRNNVQLGQYGRNRTNVWQHPGANTSSRTSEEGNLLAMHPTVKPVALVADALLDVSARGDLVLDPFLGAGTTLIAAERVGRTCCGIELNPSYVDVAIRRWQKHTGDFAIHTVTNKRFDEITAVAEVNRG